MLITLKSSGVVIVNMVEDLEDKVHTIKLSNTAVMESIDGDAMSYCFDEIVIDAVDEIEMIRKQSKRVLSASRLDKLEKLVLDALGELRLSEASHKKLAKEKYPYLIPSAPAALGINKHYGVVRHSLNELLKFIRAVK